MAEHEREAFLRAVKVGVEGRDEKLNQQTQWLLKEKGEMVGKGSSRVTSLALTLLLAPTYI